MSGVKAHSDDVRSRLERLLVLFNPYSDEPLTYGLFADAIGDTEDAVRKWHQRNRIPPAGARKIVEAANRTTIRGVTLDWVLSGVGAPMKSTNKARAVAEPTTAPSGDGSVRRDTQAPVRLAPATDWDVKMLAQRMTVHWKRIAETRELTGPSLIPLLEDEARWFRGQGYMECYDATLDLIREIRWIEKKRDKSGGR